MTKAYTIKSIKLKELLICCFTKSYNFLLALR